MTHRAVIFAACFFVTPFVQPVRGSESPWLYGRQADVEHAFDVTIKVQTGESATTYQGMLLYSIDRLTDEQVQITYRGQLQEQAARPPGTPGRSEPFRSLPPLPGIFGRTAFTGTTQQTNRIILSRAGEVLAFEGSSQLPHLLGHASLLPFETLPADAATAKRPEGWSTDSTISIAQHRPREFGALPLSMEQQQNKVQFARSETRYTLIEQTDQGAKVRKVVRMTSPEVSGETSFEIGGQGVWEFDFQTGMPTSTDVNLELKLIGTNVQATLPISIAVRRLPAAELESRQAAMKQQAEKVAAEQAERRRVARLPLDKQTKAEVLRLLNSNRAGDVVRAIHQLYPLQPETPDPELLAAVREKLTSSDPAVASSAERLLSRWSPEYAQWLKINEAYQNGGSVASSGKFVAPKTPLTVGQLVQYKEQRLGNRWKPAEVAALLEDSTVLLRPRGSGANRPVTVARDQIQLAPDEVDQPGKPGLGSPFASSARPPRSSAPRTPSQGRPQPLPPASRSNAARMWTDVTGQFRIEAVVLEITDSEVQLKRTDGKEIAVPLEKLSEEDRAYVRHLQAAQSKSAADNPFD